MSPKNNHQPDDRVQNQRLLEEQRMLRQAERGEPKPRKKPTPGPHWYKDRQSSGGVRKG